MLNSPFVRISSAKQQLDQVHQEDSLLRSERHTIITQFIYLWHLMSTFKIEPTLTTLDVSLDDATGTLSFAGRSLPENSAVFFKPIMDWVENYSKAPKPKTTCNFRLEYFNSASRKCVVDVLRVLDDIHKKGNTVTITWNYDEGDDNMKETGEEYEALFSMPFEFVAY
jgi:hypothetical protein